jgi:hypothetical protein
MRYGGEKADLSKPLVSMMNRADDNCRLVIVSGGDRSGASASLFARSYAGGPCTVHPRVGNNRVEGVLTLRRLATNT